MMVKKLAKKQMDTVRKSKHLKTCLGPAFVTGLDQRGLPLALRLLRFLDQRGLSLALSSLRFWIREGSL